MLIQSLNMCLFIGLVLYSRYKALQIIYVSILAVCGAQRYCLRSLSKFSAYAVASSFCLFFAGLISMVTYSCQYYNTKSSGRLLQQDTQILSAVYHVLRILNGSGMLYKNTLIANPFHLKAPIAVQVVIKISLSSNASRCIFIFRFLLYMFASYIK